MNYELNIIHNSSVLELWKEAERPVDVRIEGTSMMPLIRPGDTVSLRLINGDELKKTGDLIAFRQDGCLIVHRFIKQRKINESLWFCQKGDNLSGWSWISEDDMLGRVESIRGLGRKVIYMNTRPWTCINRIMGSSWFLWISFVEKVHLLKAYNFVGRPLTILGGLACRMGRALNSAYGYVVIKTIGGIKT
ncbi:MAG: S24 family peptidase [Thermodesulfobacteriota bacterium]|nr:S24 family peptidase [Thermodesulfobacteriota bacterium]